MTNLRKAASGQFLNLAAPSLDYGSQLTWAIDALNGSDDNPGTLSSPLRTMAEFNARLSGNLLAVAASLFLLSDVVDQQLTLCPLRVLAGASLSVFGTATSGATATISVVSGLGPGGTFPWQLTTTGAVWSAADIGKRLVLPGGQVSWVCEVIDASNVVAGAFVSSAGAVVTPVAAQTLTVQTLSRALPPVLLGTSFYGALSPVTVSSLDVTVNATPNGNFQTSGLGVQLFGCKLTIATGQVIAQAFGPFNLRGCFLSATGAGFCALRGSGGGFLFQACSFVGIPLSVTDSTSANFSNGFFSNSPMTVLRRAVAAATGALHWRNTAAPLSVSQGGLFQQQNFAVSGAVGNTGVGVTVKASGQYVYVNTGNKPSVTGASDTLIGLTARTYAQIPYVDLQLNAVPPTVATLVGTPAAMVLE